MDHSAMTTTPGKAKLASRKFAITSSQSGEMKTRYTKRPWKVWFAGLRLMKLISALEIIYNTTRNSQEIQETQSVSYKTELQQNNWHDLTIYFSLMFLMWSEEDLVRVFSHKGEFSFPSLCIKHASLCTYKLEILLSLKSWKKIWGTRCAHLKKSRMLVKLLLQSNPSVFRALCVLRPKKIPRWFEKHAFVDRLGEGGNQT